MAGRHTHFSWRTHTHTHKMDAPHSSYASCEEIKALRKSIDTGLSAFPRGVTAIIASFVIPIEVIAFQAGSNNLEIWVENSKFVWRGPRERMVVAKKSWHEASVQFSFEHGFWDVVARFRSPRPRNHPLGRWVEWRSELFRRPDKAAAAAFNVISEAGYHLLEVFHY